MDIDYQVGEVELSYKSTVREKRKIATSSDAYGMLLSTFREDTIGYWERWSFPINQQLERSEKSLHLPMRTECYYLRSEKIQSAIRNILDFYRFDLTN